MNEMLLRQLGFSKQVDRKVVGCCTSCGKKVKIATEFRDELSKKEFTISGMCQNCQDEIFVNNK